MLGKAEHGLEYSITIAIWLLEKGRKREGGKWLNSDDAVSGMFRFDYWRRGEREREGGKRRGERRGIWMMIINILYNSPVLCTNQEFNFSNAIKASVCWTSNCVHDVHRYLCRLCLGKWFTDSLNYLVGFGHPSLLMPTATCVDCAFSFIRSDLLVAVQLSKARFVFERM